MRNLVEAHLPLLEEVLRTVRRRKCQSVEEAEDFTSWARLRLVEDDGGIFRKFQGKSSLRTYLTTVVLNLFRDYRIEKWGKWRPSSEARRLGAVAVRLECLLWREGLSLGEAIEILRRNFRVSESVEELEAIAAHLPQRPSRRFVEESAAEKQATLDGVEDRVRHRDASIIAQRVERGLSEGMRRLTSEDRTILKLWAEDGFTVAAIAKTLGLEQKPLYRRMERLKEELRVQLESNGVGSGEVREIIEWPGVSLRVDYGLEETPRPGPSQDEGSS